jgi:rare lipoprotein A
MNNFLFTKRSILCPAVLFTFLFLMVPFKNRAQQVDTTVAKLKTPQNAKEKRILYGVASFYSNKFNGRETANGEIFSQNKFTCACNVIPLGIWLRVTNLRNGRVVIVKTNDRLHPKMKRIVDLTRAAAVKLGFVSAGLTRVKVEVLGKKAPVL